MATYLLNTDAVDFVEELIGKRRYVLQSTWTEANPDAETENAFLERHDWVAYRWHPATEGASRRPRDVSCLRGPVTSAGCTAAHSSPASTAPRSGTTRTSNSPPTSCSRNSTARPPETPVSAWTASVNGIPLDRTLPGLGVLGERPGELRGIQPGEGAAALEQLGV